MTGGRCHIIHLCLTRVNDLFAADLKQHRNRSGRARAADDFQYRAEIFRLDWACAGSDNGFWVKRDSL